MSTNSREVIIILGKTGYGKSTWVNKYAVALPRIFVFDPYKAFPAEYCNEEKLLALHDSGELKTRANYRIGTNVLTDFDLIGSLSYVTGNCCLLVEECGFAFFKGERIPEWLQECIFLGRHQSLTLIFTAQRAVSIPIELRSQANRFISFRQTELRDVQWCEQYIGADNVEELPNLKLLECIDSDGESVSRYFIKPLGGRVPDSTRQDQQPKVDPAPSPIQPKGV